jgi:hypothetical protein
MVMKSLANYPCYRTHSLLTWRLSPLLTGLLARLLSESDFAFSVIMKKIASAKVMMAVRLWSCFAIAVPTGAATFTVSTTNDSGAGSLRQAIADAAPGDTINFAVSGTIGLTYGELLITNNLTINGPGETNLAISGRGYTRIFDIASNVVANISGMSITGGAAGNGNAGAFYAVGSPPQAVVIPAGNGGSGGGILNAGTLTLSNCVLSGNRAGTGGQGYDGGCGGCGVNGRTGGAGGDGGAGGSIYNTGSLMLNACVINSSSAGAGGNGGNGGIDYSGPFYLGGGVGGRGGAGGGIYSTMPVLLDGCTIVENHAGMAGMGGFG